MDKLLKQIRLCINEEEVWELIKNVKLSSEHQANIGDEAIILTDSHNHNTTINLPMNELGLSARLISYFSFNGYLGHISYGGGLQAYVSKFRALLNDFNEIEVINNVSDIDENFIEKWLRQQLDKGYGAMNIVKKLARLEDWITLSEMLPYFLSLDNINIHNCISYNELMDRYNKEVDDYGNKDEHSVSKYPLYLLLPLLQEAMKYVEEYTDDIEILMAERNNFNDIKNWAGPTIVNRAHRFMKNCEYKFKEEELAKLQKYCKSLGSLWRSDPSELLNRSPRTIMSEAVDRWQAANLILLGFFSAARSSEISRQERNIRTEKTKYHEIDQGYNFTRIIWKTSRYGKLHTTPLPPLGIQAYHNLSRHSVQVDGKSTGVLQFPVWMKLDNIMNADRMGYVLKKFSYWVHGEKELYLTPHQLRHAMASILNHLNDHNGLMLVSRLLGHDSSKMTLTYETQIKTIVLNQMEHMANTNEEIAEAFKEYKEKESREVLKKVVMPDIHEGKIFVGPAKGIVQFTGSIVNDPESFFAFHSQAIKDGQIAFTQTPTCICVRTKSNIEQMACQRGIMAEDYSDIPIQSSACQGSSCTNSLFTEQKCKMLMEQTQSVKDLVPKDLQEMASDWFFVVGDGLEVPNKKIIAEYEEAMKSKEKVG